MICYFSGTGNSQLAAKQIGKITKDEIISINYYLKKGKGNANSFHSERPWVFVAPTYAWRLPRVVEQWIRQARFEGNGDAYFVLTCGGGCGNAAAYAKKLCAEKGMHYCGLASVNMPENYLAMFSTPDAAQCQAVIAKAEPHIAYLAEQIKNGVPFAEASPSLGDSLLSGPVNGLFYPFFVHDKGFTVLDTCVSCSKCAKRCPLGNIDMENGKPVWKGNCTHCMACIAGCPAEAIEYKSKSKGMHRHYIMEEEKDLCVSDSRDFIE